MQSEVRSEGLIISFLERRCCRRKLSLPLSAFGTFLEHNRSGKTILAQLSYRNISKANLMVVKLRDECRNPTHLSKNLTDKQL